MADITYGDRRAAAQAPPRRKGFFARFLEAMQEARMRQAEREIARHLHLLPPDLERAGNRLSSRNEDALPFGGW